MSLQHTMIAKCVAASRRFIAKHVSASGIITKRVAASEISASSCVSCFAHHKQTVLCKLIALPLVGNLSSSKSGNRDSVGTRQHKLRRRGKETRHQDVLEVSALAVTSY